MNLQDIKNPQLEKSAFGYKADSVDSFVDSVYTYAKGLEDQNAVLEKKIAVLAKKIEEYRADESNMKEALVGAQRLGQTVINEANEKANVTVAQANLQAEKILKDAEEEAAKRAKELKVQIASEEKALLKMQKEVSEFKSKLLSIYKSHLDVITALPEVEEEEGEKPAEEASGEPAFDEASDVQPDGEQSEAIPADGNREFHVNIDEPGDGGEQNPRNERADNSFTEKFGELKFGRNFKE